MKEMDDKRYHTVNVSMIFADKIEEVIASNKHGYINVPDFVKEARARALKVPPSHEWLFRPLQ